MVYTCSYPYDDDEYTEDLTIKKLRKYGLFAADAAAVEKNKPDLLQRRTLNWEAKDVKRVSVAAKRYTPDEEDRKPQHSSSKKKEKPQ